MLKKGTGIKITKLEAQLLGNLYGRAYSPGLRKLNKVQTAWIKKDGAFLLNMFLAILGDRYGYDWKTHEINPDSQEVIYVCKDCDAELPEGDIKIE